MDSAPSAVRWVVVEADATTDLDYTAARVILGRFGELAKRDIGVAFARVSPSLRADMDRHGVTAIIGPDKVFPKTS